GTPTGIQTLGDCEDRACDGKGGIEMVPNDADVPTPAKECMVGVCVSGMPKTPPAPGGTSCGAVGKTCDWNGNCISCTPIGNHCLNGCIDMDEGDIDCGGTQCPVCAKGKHCNSTADCEALTVCLNNLCQ